MTGRRLSLAVWFAPSNHARGNKDVHLIGHDLPGPLAFAHVMGDGLRAARDRLASAGAFLACHL